MRPFRRDMQIVFQDPFGSLSPRLSVAEIVEEGLIAQKTRLNAAERREAVARALADTGVDPASMDRYPHEFSGGQRQRIAIARAMALDPKFVVLDEPTSALDMSVQAQIVDLLRDLQKRRALAYLFISHDLKVVRALASEIIVMRRGEVVESGPAREVFAAPRERLYQGPVRRRLRDRSGRRRASSASRERAMGRAIIIVLDSVGCGGAADAAAYGDAGADTLGHLAAACAEGRGDRAGLRAGPLQAAPSRRARPRPGDARLERLRRAGLRLRRAARPMGLRRSRPRAARTRRRAIGRSPARRSRSTGAISAPTIPTFPASLTAALIAEAKLPGILGDRHASGTAIIDELGEEHMRTRQADLLHLGRFGVPDRRARGDVRARAALRALPHRAAPVRSAERSAASSRGRSSARRAADFARTANRKDFSMPPLPGNLLQRAAQAGREIVTIGKIGDIFAHRDTGREIKGKSNADHVDLALRGARRDRRTAASSSSTSSISTPNTAIAATSPATPPAWRRSTRGCRKSKRRCAPTISAC